VTGGIIATENSGNYAWGINNTGKGIVKIKRRKS